MTATPRPELVSDQLDDVFALANQLGDDYRWMHGAAYSRTTGEKVGGRSGKSDPTAVVALNGTARSHVRQAAKLIADARSALLGAKSALGKAGNAVDNRSAELPSEHDVRIPRLVTKKELDDARLAKLRRHSRGEGHGAA